MHYTVVECVAQSEIVCGVTVIVNNMSLKEKTVPSLDSISIHIRTNAFLNKGKAAEAFED